MPCTKKMKFLYGLVFAAVICLLPSRAPAQGPTILEYPYLYKSPRAMGMGGAYTAVGGRNDTLFYNPAALSNMPRDKGWEVDLINVSVGVGKNSVNFYRDVKDALDTGDLNRDGSASDDQERAVNEVLGQYRGENLHLRAADFTAIGKSWGGFSFAVGGLASGGFDAVAHQGFSSDGMLELNTDAIYGGIGGFSFGVTDNLFLGLTVKALTRDMVSHDFTARELVDHQNDLNDYIMDQLKTTGSAVGFDAGLIWNLAPYSLWRPSVGVSAVNIGDLDFGEAGIIPMSVNVGAALHPDISWARSLTIAADYVDITNNFTQDKDKAKRIRYGAELQLFDRLLAEMTVRAGMYEGSPTLGADIRLLIFTINYTMYTEEVGAYAGQDKDKRQMLTLNIGW